MHIRPYLPSDFETVLGLFRLNTPTFFAEKEGEDLSTYLQKERELYFVVEIEGVVHGSGGINFSKVQQAAIISWDILHPDQQRKGIGTALLEFRIKKIHTFNEIKRIQVRTSQVSYPFYEKNGFHLLETKKDFWAPGFDLYKMELIIR